VQGSVQKGQGVVQVHLLRYEQEKVQWLSIVRQEEDAERLEDFEVSVSMEALRRRVMME